jgi:ribonuclease HI
MPLAGRTSEKRRENTAAMSEPGDLTINTDGGARGNPGPAAYAYVIVQQGAPPIEEAGCLGHATNNQAEYTALVRALEHAARLGTNRRLLIQSDSELLVKQMNGEYRVKDDGLRLLYEEACRLRRRFPSVAIRHVPRNQNAWADRLYNEALDGQCQHRPAKHAKQPQSASKPAAKESAVQADAVECLRAAATAWARGDATQPPPEQVWEQLWSILEEQGVIRRPRK